MSGLSHKQEQAITSLLSESSIAAAAAKVGVTERTVYRWLDDPAFTEAYREARRQAVQQAISQLQQLSSDAVLVLAAMMNDTRTPAYTRISAAKTILEFAIKAIELEDVQARLSQLEQAYAAQR